MPCNLLNSQLGGKESVKEFASINCQFVGVPFVTGGVGVGVAERLFKAKYPATPAKTTTRIINAIFANPFWFTSLIIAKLIIDFDFRIKKFSSPKMRNRQFVFAPKIEYKLVAESAERADKLREATSESLTFPTWCCNYTLCANFFRAETERMNQPRHRLAEPRRTPKKNVPCFSDLRATNFF